MSSVRALVSLTLLLCAAAAAPASAAIRYDPRLRFRTIRTAHFDVHAHQGVADAARRLAVIAEHVREKFGPVLGVPRGRVQIILVDQSDLSNGWATPLPYDTIEIAAAPPSPESLIGNTSDWLELVFTHEYTHILHLDRSRGLMQGVRRVFGRVPVAFPNGFLPTWQVEGLATFEESRMTGEGRVRAGDFRAIVDVAAAAGRLEPIDRAAGGLDDWPGGTAPYAYGALFHQFLSDTYGPERLAQLADRTAGRVPFFGSGAFKTVFGRTERQLWNDFRGDREHRAATPGETDARARRLTHHGFVVTAPRLGADGAVFYRIANADGFPALMSLPPGGGVPRRVAWRVQGNRTSVRRDWVVFDQVDRVRSTAVYSDLYAVRAAERADGTVHRLTRDARAADPDLSPDGARIVCTVQGGGRRALALLPFSTSVPGVPQILVDDPEADYTGPRWSPDGRQIVAARRRAGRHELVLIDAETRGVRVLLAGERLVTPSWTPDGASVLFAATSGEGPFNIYAIDLAAGAARQLTDAVGGAQFPEIAPDGTLIYVGYTPAGSDLFSVAVDLSAGTAGGATLEHPIANTAPASREALVESRKIDDRPYRPWRTLVPTFWTPIIEVDADEVVVGAATGMVDALGRHAYAIDAGWTQSRARPDWHAAYAYDRWRPTFFASYSDETDPVREGLIRSRELFAGALLPFRHVRSTETLIAGTNLERDTLVCRAGVAGGCTGRIDRDRRSVRGGWLHDSRRIFGYSVSVEEGFVIEAGAETSRTMLGSDGNGGAVVLDARGYRRLGRTHTVVAARIAAAEGWGAKSIRRRFSAGGAGGGAPVFAFGREAIGLLRGFSPEDVVGARAAVVNLDLRLPVARVQRGVRSWPIFFRSVHAAAFADAGHAWDGTFRASQLRTSIGGEVSVDVVLGHFLPLTVVAGVAATRDPVAGRNRATLFGRIGHAF